MEKKELLEKLAAKKDTNRPYIVLTKEEYEDSDFFCDDDLVAQTVDGGDDILIASEPIASEEDMYAMMDSAGMYTGQ